jgi:HEAT repeat protein
VESGYAAYVLGLLRCREATPDLRQLSASANVFVRYSAGRALAECGDREGAAPILKAIITNPVPPNAPIAQVEDPHYQALAARAYMELGKAQRQEGIGRLVELMRELESWEDINAPGRLESARRMLATVSGRYFISHEQARAWQQKQAGKAGH